MKLYNCLIKKDSDSKIEDVVLIADEFSFKALFFNFFFFAWFFYHRMWRDLLLLIIAFAVFACFSKLSFGFDKIYIESAFFILVALNANYWLFEHFKKNKKYEFVGVIFANNSTEAKILAIKQIEESNLETCEYSSKFFSEKVFDPKLHRKLKKSKSFS